MDLIQLDRIGTSGGLFRTR